MIKTSMSDMSAAKVPASRIVDDPSVLFIEEAAARPPQPLAPPHAPCIARRVGLCSTPPPPALPAPAPFARRIQAGDFMISTPPSDATDQTAVSSNRLILMVYTAAIFTSALLLFSVQPLFTKMVLPRLGGSPAGWSVATGVLPS